MTYQPAPGVWKSTPARRLLWALKQVHLRDFKVRVVNPTAESAAKVRVVVEFAVPGSFAPRAESNEVPRYFTTIGVNENVVDASWQALEDAFVYHLIESKAPVR